MWQSLTLNHTLCHFYEKPSFCFCYTILLWCISNYSRLTPTSFALRNPRTLSRQVNTIAANIVQNTARYPAIRALGELLSVLFEALVTEVAMSEVTVKPMAVPSWAQVLNTAPLSACMCAGNTSETTSRPTVNKISQLKGVRIYMKMGDEFQFSEWTDEVYVPEQRRRRTSTAILDGSKPLTAARQRWQWRKLVQTTWPACDWQRCQ